MVGYRDPCPCCGNKRPRPAALERWASCPAPRQGTPSPAKFARSLSEPMPMPSAAATSSQDEDVSAAAGIPISAATHQRLPPPPSLPSPCSASLGPSIGSKDADLLNRPPRSCKPPEPGPISPAAHHQPPPPPPLPSPGSASSLGRPIGDQDPDLPNRSPSSSTAPEATPIRSVGSPDSDTSDGVRSNSPDKKMKTKLKGDLFEAEAARKTTKVCFKCPCGSTTEIVIS